MEEFKNEVSSELKKMGSFNDWLFLKKMITPVVIQIIYWLGILVVIILGLIAIIRSFGAFGGGAIGLLSGILMIILGPIMVRVYCEILVVMFNIYEELKKLNAK
ncbi:MAG TPA: DUF4282 domain-containing protein [Caldisericia bacterium]|nr:DUF4282 domain-containing protein [Caldisericia bacterium]